MVVPYDIYVRFLVTKGLYDLDKVNEELDILNLQPVTQATFDAQYKIVHQTVPAGIWSQMETGKHSKDLLKWAAILEVEDLWYMERSFLKESPEKRSAAKLAIDINQDPKLRVVINALLIKQVGAKDIVQPLNARFSTLLREDSLEIYSRFFFSTRRMTRGSWKSFLRGCSDREASTYFTALSEPLDVLKAELELPAQVSTTETIQYLLMKSYQKAKQYLNVNTPDANSEARCWIDTSLKLVDKYEKYRTGDRADFANTLQMEFDFVDTEFAMPDKEALDEIAARLKADPGVEKSA
jgi:hypothetical protein